MTEILFIKTSSMGDVLHHMPAVTETRRRVTLFRGVYPIKFRGAPDPEKALHMAEDELLKRGAVQNGDLIVLTIGEPFGKARNGGRGEVTCGEVIHDTGP